MVSILLMDFNIARKSDSRISDVKLVSFVSRYNAVSAIVCIIESFSFILDFCLRFEPMKRHMSVIFVMWHGIFKNKLIA